MMMMMMLGPRRVCALVAVLVQASALVPPSRLGTGLLHVAPQQQTTTRLSPPVSAGPSRSLSRGSGGRRVVAVSASAVSLVPSAVRAAARWAVPTIAAAACGVWMKNRLDRPSRPYDRDANSVGREYDAWTREGILEYYWGEHIHLGYYTDEELAKGYKKKNFIEAKYNFTDRMMRWGGVVDAVAAKGGAPVSVLDVGCGIGGTTRYLANSLGPQTTVTGITLSPEQAARASALAAERHVPNARFQVMDALAMDFPDESFDVVWGCESGEHMPDKGEYIREMTRVLKPGGKIVVATWCQRDNATQSFTAEEERALDFLYSEWTHPYFISIDDYVRLMDQTGQLENLVREDWNKNTMASWRHSIWVGVFDPWPVVRAGPRVWWKCLRDGICLERMHRAFDRGLMEYGMMKGTKKLKAAA